MLNPPISLSQYQDALHETIADGNWSPSYKITVLNGMNALLPFLRPILYDVPVRKRFSNEEDCFCMSFFLGDDHAGPHNMHFPRFLVFVDKGCCIDVVASEAWGHFKDEPAGFSFNMDEPSASIKHKFLKLLSKPGTYNYEYSTA